MVYVEFQYLYRKRKIFIQGEVDDKTFRYVTLLQKIGQRFYLDQVIDFFITLINYENQQFGSVLIIVLSILSTQVSSHFLFNTLIQNGLAHLTLAGLILYTFVVHILFSKNYKLYLIGVLQILLGIAVGVIQGNKFQDHNITLYFFIVNTACLILGILKKLFEEELQNYIFSIFQFESNFLIAIYVVGKMQQFYYPYLMNSQLDSYNLIPTIICMTLINSLKIWNLFDFNSVYLIGLLTTVHNNQAQQLQKQSLFSQIFHIGEQLLKAKQPNNKQKDSIIENKTQAYQDKKVSDSNDIQSKKSSLHTSAIVGDDSTSQPSASQQMQDYKVQNEQLSYSYTSYICMAFVANFMLAGFMITLILFKKYTDSQLYLMSLGMFKMLVIMLYCEHQSVIMAQNEKHSFFYISYLLSDIFMIGHLIMIVVFYGYMSYSTDYGNFSIVIHSIIPILTTSMYRSLSRQMNKSQQNRSILHFYFLWVLLLGMRQTLVVVSYQYIRQLYLLIDSMVLIYSCFVILVVSKGELYKWIIEQIQKIRRIRKYKLYIMQSLRNWKFDITQLNQRLFLINIIILFLGYNYFQKQYSISCDYQIQYLIISCSAIIIHLLQSYNNYYTQRQIDQQSTPLYSPYFSYIILLIASIFYAVFSYFINSQHNSYYNGHQRWSILILVLVIFISLTSVFAYYSYETVPQFRTASKPFNLTVSYFIFYYPFITVFTVFFFAQNLQTFFIFRYSIAGFTYLTFSAVITSIFVHAILNLTQKSKRTLFIIKSLSQQMKKLNIKQDPQFVSMIQNLYDLMDGNNKKLLSELKHQKITKLIIHDDIDIKYDYSFVQPDKKQKQNQYVKVFADNIQNEGSQANHSRRTLKIHSIRHISTKKLETKIHFYKKSSNEQKLGLKKKVSLNLRKHKLQNKNMIQIKRLIDINKSLSLNRIQLIKIKKMIQSNEQLRQIIKSEQRLQQIMHRFYNFVSDPQQQISYEMFNLINQLLRINTTQQNLEIQFNKYSQNGQSINQQGFRNFIVQHFNNTIQITNNQNSSINNNCNQIWKQFIYNQLFTFFIKANDIFKYYMKRKNISPSQSSILIWKSLHNQIQHKQLIQFKQKYNLKKFKAMGKKIIDTQQNYNITTKFPQQTNYYNQNHFIDEVIEINKYQKPNQVNQKNKKHILFMSSQSIYTAIVDKLIQTLKQYQKIQHQHFKLQSIKFGLSNMISILTKLFDFTYFYMYGSLYAMYAYGMQDYSNNKYILSFVNYNYVFGVALLGVVAYVGLIAYHKKQFSNGSLGVDQNQRTLSFTSFKFYTTFLLFIMGSSLSNVFIMTSLNSYMCDQTTHTLWNFPDNQCYSLLHISQMFGSLLILLTYYPLASLIFPFSSAIDRTLQIKYKAEYEIVYLQSKFLVNGINVIFNQLNFQTQQLIKSVTKTIICIILAVLFYRLKPCSVEFINNIQLKIYVGLVIINAAGILCYFVGLKITIISFGILLFLYILYSFITSVKISDNNLPTIQKQNCNNLVDQKFKKQQIFKIRLKQANQNDGQLETNSQLYKFRNQYLATLQESDINLTEQNNKKFNAVQNLFRDQYSASRTSKLKRKNKEAKEPTFTIKNEKTQEANQVKTNKISIRGSPSELIPAAKRKSKQNLNNLIKQITRKN